MRRAPVIVVPHSSRDVYLDRYAAPDKGWTDRDEARWPVPYWHIDAGFASLLILLGAVDAELGACFFGSPPEHLATYREAFGVPESYTPIGAITLGYPATVSHRRCVVAGNRCPRWSSRDGGGRRPAQRRHSGIVTVAPGRYAGGSERGDIIAREIVAREGERPA
jgi:hypothetical protein